MDLVRTPLSFFSAALLALALGPGLAAQAAASPDAQGDGIEQNRSCFECHGSENSMEFGDGTEVSIQVDKRTLLLSAHGKLACVVCHENFDAEQHATEEQADRKRYRNERARRCVLCHDERSSELPAELLPAQRLAGHLHAPDKEGAPLCTDCHAAHAAPRGGGSPALTSRGCATCHEQEYLTYSNSAHGRALGEEANPDLPACTNCHPGHEMPGSAAAKEAVRLGRPCISCHGDGPKMARYGLSDQVVSTYLNDFHGVSVRFYRESEQGASMPTLVCADCHGIHDVVKVDSVPPEQMKARLLGVCRSCHEDVAESFPDAWLSHYEPSLDKAPLVFLVRIAYWVFIPFVILGLSLQIFLHLVVHQRRRKRQGLGPRREAHADDVGKTVVRFALRQRIEHLLVMVTFVLLVLTGLPQKFADSGWAVVVTNLFGGVDMMRAIHRVTGIVFSGLCVLHLAIAIGLVLSGRTKMNMVPTRQDFTDARDNLRFYAGITDKAPKFDRYDYRQKFEYWGMIVGSFVMIISGFMLYFPMLTAEFLPGQFIPAAKAAHTYEAMMALLTIVIWHMYGAHLNPDCYPMDRSIFTGKIPLSFVKHEHPLEWERDQDRLVVVAEPGAGPQDSGGVAGPNA